MNKKIISLLVCILMMSTIPLATGMAEVKSEPEPLGIGRVYLRGLCFNLMDLGNINYGWAIRLRYIEFTPTERTVGWVTMKRVAFGDSILFGRMYEPGPLGFFTFVFGIFRGGIEVQ